MAAGFTPVIVGGLYSAYRQLFGAAAAQALAEAPAAPPPPAPPALTANAADSEGENKPDA